MAQIESWYNQDLKEPVKVHYLGGNIFSQDNQGNLIGVNVFSNGNPVTVAGSVSANIIRADGATVAVAGVKTGNTAYVLLPSAAYAVPGPISIILKLSADSRVTTLCAVVANVYQSSTDTVVDPGTVIPSIQDLIDAIDEAVASIPLDYSALWREVDESIFGSIKEWNKTSLIDITLGKTLANGGVYKDAAYGYENLRAATQTYYPSGNYIRVVPLTGYKVEIDYYDENKNFIDYDGWITSEMTFRALGKYFRVVVAGDTSIASVYTTIATIYTQGNLYDVNRRVDELNSMYGGEVELPAWVVGKYPNWPTGQIWSGSDYKYSRRVRVVPGAKYRYTGVMNGACGIIFYDESNTFISGSGTMDSEFTAPSNACYADIGAKGLTSDPHLYFCAEAVEVETGKARELELTELPGVINVSLVVNPDTGSRVVLNVNSGEQYLITSYCYIANTYPIVMFFDGDTLVSYENLTSSGGSVTDAPVVVPDGINKMIVNGKPLEIKVKRVVSGMKEAIDDIYTQIGNQNVFEGKTIVWFGTSIPANGWFGYEHPFAYPQRVGRLLGANVINEAIGSSCVHCKDPTRISADNPYGFKGGFESTSRCLSNSLEEANWIIEHWNSDIWTSGVPSEMTEWLAGKIRSFGYEEKLDKYLTENTFPDLFVFDHGYNDSSDVNNYYDTYGRYTLYCFRGAMNFLIKRILDYNPNANIVIIGNYTTTRDVPQMQDTVAKDWALPICKQWEQLGLSQTEYLTCDGYWSESGGVYTWVQDGTDRTYTVKDRLIPDHVHPHSDPTGKVTKKMAQNLAKWFLSNVPMYDE